MENYFRCIKDFITGSHVFKTGAVYEQSDDGTIVHRRNGVLYYVDRPFGGYFTPWRPQPGDIVSWEGDKHTREYTLDLLPTNGTTFWAIKFNGVATEYVYIHQIKPILDRVPCGSQKTEVVNEKSKAVSDSVSVGVENQALKVGDLVQIVDDRNKFGNILNDGMYIGFIGRLVSYSKTLETWQLDSVGVRVFREEGLRRIDAVDGSADHGLVCKTIETNHAAPPEKQVDTKGLSGRAHVMDMLPAERHLWLQAENKRLYAKNHPNPSPESLQFVAGICSAQIRLHDNKKALAKLDSERAILMKQIAKEEKIIGEHGSLPSGL